MNDPRPQPLVEPASAPHHAHPRGTFQRLLVWHRRLGLAVSVIVLLLSVTGLLLNHTDALKLDQTSLRADWLLRWYGYPPVAAPDSFRAGERWVSTAGGKLYLDQTPVAEAGGPALGAAQLDGGLVAAALADSVILLAPDGTVVERLGAASLPGAPQRIGLADDARLALGTAQGTFVADADLIQWQPAAAAPAWSEAQAAPPALRDALAQAQRGPGLSAERVLLDLHSGRLFGAWGPWVMDAAAIVFVILALTGIVNWGWRRQRAKKMVRFYSERRRQQ
jgi:hypothetical protein